ncbi:unnamed protein product, partial [Meganyctiphanes norvegica]
MPSLPTPSWKSQIVQDNKLTTISNLTPDTIYTISVQAHTGIGPGPLSDPVKVKAQQGVPSQPTNLQPVHVTATEMELRWTRPSYQGENIISYELYWNMTCTGLRFYIKSKNKTIPEGESYTLGDLHPNCLYNFWLAGKSQHGEGPTTAPISVYTEQSTPDAPPSDIRAVAVDSGSILVEWSPPLEHKQNGFITYYKLMYVNSSQNDSDAMVIPINSPDDRDFTIKDLEKRTEYRVWMLAGTIVGDGLKSEPIQVRTDENGEEGRSKPQKVGMPGGIPTKPKLHINGTLNYYGKLSVYVQWDKPQETYGDLLGYRLRYGPKGDQLSTVTFEGELINDKTLEDMQRGIEYEFRMSAKNHIDYGQESVIIYSTPEAPPSGSPVNIER